MLKGECGCDSLAQDRNREGVLMVDPIALFPRPPSFLGCTCGLYERVCAWRRENFHAEGCLSLRPDTEAGCNCFLEAAYQEKFKGAYHAPNCQSVTRQEPLVY